jgi:hypothetical protein
VRKRPTTTTRNKIWVSEEYYDLLWDCQRYNCGFCLPHDEEKDPELIAIDKEYREKTIAYLKEMREMVEMSMFALESTWLLMETTIDVV